MQIIRIPRPKPQKHSVTARDHARGTAPTEQRQVAAQCPACGGYAIMPAVGNKTSGHMLFTPCCGAQAARARDSYPNVQKDPHNG